jgi:hypothetical protein
MTIEAIALSIALSIALFAIVYSSYELMSE